MVNRSSTTSQPTATCPAEVCSSRLSASMRTSTTVLATASERPNTIDAGVAYPATRAAPAPSANAVPPADEGAGYRDAAYGEQFIDVKLKADAEHEQDDADVGKLLGQARVGHEPGRIGTNHHSGEEVARRWERVRDAA